MTCKTGTESFGLAVREQLKDLIPQEAFIAALKMDA